MSDDPKDLTEWQRNKILLDVHHALVGDPLDPTKPGLVAIVGRHHQALYGAEEKGGLVADNAKYKRMFWIGSGIAIAVQLSAASLFAWFLAAKYPH